MNQKKRRSDRESKHIQRPWLFPLIGAIVLAGLAFLLLRGRSASQPLTATEVNSAPSLKVDQEQVDLGDVKLGQFVQVSLPLTNVGDQPLRFSEQPYLEVMKGC